MRRHILCNNINEKISYLDSQIQLNNRNSLQDIDIYSEYFFRDLFNLIHDYELKNANDQHKNAIAIDLLDEKNKVSIQVTAQKGIEKVKDTINKFESNNLHNIIDYLELFIIVLKKSQHEVMPTTNGLYKFARKDLGDLFNDIKSLNITKLEQVHTLFVSELKVDREQVVNIETNMLIQLLKLLDEKSNTISELSEENAPRPEYKIHERFANHKDILINTYRDLFGIYGNLLSQVKKELSFDTIKTRKITSFLKYTSDNFLTKANGNPEEALENLVNYFEKELGNHNIVPSKNVILFYLVDEIYNCNIFPNKEKIC